MDRVPRQRPALAALLEQLRREPVEEPWRPKLLGLDDALAIASYLSHHPKVKKLYYPGLPNHPQHALAKRQMNGFGALIAFMGVNAAAFMRYYVRNPEKKLSNLLPPVLGFVICLLLWLNLSTPAKIAGVIWMAVGIGFGAWKTRGFRGNLINFELPPEDAEA